MDGTDGGATVDLASPKIVAAIVSALLALFVRSKARKADTVSTPDLSQNKPEPEKDPIQQTTPAPTPATGRWLTIRPDADGAYKFKEGEVYRGAFEVMGAASWFDSRAAVQSYAQKVGLPLRTVKDLGGDRYQVETTPVPATVRLAKHSAVRVEKIERWQSGS